MLYCEVRCCAQTGNFPRVCSIGKLKSSSTTKTRVYPTLRYIITPHIYRVRVVLIHAVIRFGTVLRLVHWVSLVLPVYLLRSRCGHDRQQNARRICAKRCQMCSATSFAIFFTSVCYKYRATTVCSSSKHKIDVIFPFPFPTPLNSTSTSNYTTIITIWSNIWQTWNMNLRHRQRSIFYPKRRQVEKITFLDQC